MCSKMLCTLAVALAVTSGVVAQQTPTLTQSVVLGGLEEPWDLAFLPSGEVLYTEKCKGLYILKEDNTTAFLFGIDGALDAPDVFCEGQSGVLGVAVDPEFASNSYIYTFVASSLGSEEPGATTPATNHIVRLTLSESMDTVTDRVDIITDIPFKNEASPSGDAGAHSGGRIRFSPYDGFLYITTGDNHSPTIPQDTNSLGSCVIRVDRDGEAAPGNQMPASADSRIFTYGHRNVQGIAFRPGAAFDGQPFTAEHGPNHSDEVTPLVAGGNAGWDPKNRTGLTCPEGYCGYAGTPETMPMTDTERFPDAMLPAWVWDGENRGMGPAEFLNGTQWGAWNGDLVTGIMADGTIYRLVLDDKGNATEATAIEGIPEARYRSIIQGPGGALYAVVDEPPALWKLEPAVRNGTAATPSDPASGEENPSTAGADDSEADDAPAGSAANNDTSSGDADSAAVREGSTDASSSGLVVACLSVSGLLFWASLGTLLVL